MAKEYLLSISEVLLRYASSKDGLTSQQVEELAKTAGFNELEEEKKASLLRKIWDQVKDPMILVLVGAAIVSGAFGELTDMAVILVVVILNTILGIYQESKAEEALKALKKGSAPHSRVRREGKVFIIPARELLPGDIVLLEAGDTVPADLRILEEFSLEMEEAVLTGESQSVRKSSDALKSNNEKIPLGDRLNMAYMGTSVSYGRGEGVVVATGMKTEMGKIAGLLAKTETERTPLQEKLAGLSKVLSIAVIAICVFIFFLVVLREGGFDGTRIFNALLIAVSLAVAAIPEGLVVVVTVLLSIGVTKMSRRNAIIRRLTAVETLGCTQVICTDKTGTLTQNKMTVVETKGDLKQLALAMYLCNDVTMDDQGSPLGDPTEIALFDYAKDILEKDISSLYPRVSEAPFDSERKMMSTIHTNNQGTFFQFTKGAPDIVAGFCDRILIDNQIVELDAHNIEKVLEENKAMADDALRVLACAYREYATKPEDTTPENLERNMIFIGLAGMIDPVRPEVKPALQKCVNAGIRVIMVTGDHKDTALAIAGEIGILRPGDRAITGAELDGLDDETFLTQVASISVYARVQPEHKVRIVDIWQKIGKVTAMTGDGVNDAPALKSADIGIGMGITGTDVTKNVADIVLTDDNFATIVSAVGEGRRIYENIRKAVQFLLASNLSEVLAILIATLAGWQIFAPIHVLWINLITDTFPALGLGMEEEEPDSMERPPRNPMESIFSGGLGVSVIWQGAVIGLLTLTSFMIGNSYQHELGMTMAFMTLSLCEIFHSLNMRSRDKSIFSLRRQNVYLWAAMCASFVLTIAVIYIPGLNTVFQLTALSPVEFAYAFGLALLIIPIVEAVKKILRVSGGAS